MGGKVCVGDDDDEADAVATILVTMALVER